MKTQNGVGSSKPASNIFSQEGWDNFIKNPSQYQDRIQEVKDYLVYMCAICEIKCDYQSSIYEEKIDCAKKLAAVYDTGLEGLVSADEWLSKEYRRIAENQTYQDKKMRTSKFYYLFDWFNMSRLLILRNYHVVSSAGSNSLNFLNDPLGFIGLTYGIRLIVDTAMCVKAFFPDPMKLKGMNFPESFSYRVKEVSAKFNKGNRRKRMYNDLIWFPMNLLAVVLALPTVGLSVVAIRAMQALAYGWDVCNEIFSSTGGKAYQSKKAALAMVEKRLEGLGEDDSEYEKYQSIQKELASEAKKEKRKLYYNIFTTTLILIGVAMYFFPPTLPFATALTFGLVLSGAGLTLVSGSIFNGLGKALYQTISNWWNPAPAPVVVLEDKLSAEIVPEETRALCDANTCLSDSLIQEEYVIPTAVIEPNVISQSLTVAQESAEGQPSVIVDSTMPVDTKTLPRSNSTATILDVVLVAEKTELPKEIVFDETSVRSPALSIPTPHNAPSPTASPYREDDATPTPSPSLKLFTSDIISRDSADSLSSLVPSPVSVM